ncbi:hypothetical protein DDZ14_02135 [Maritimibacter sp. 55A14]|uniref:ATP-binding protein n=1 Tax=Maritimibacter sp. 55A14 TaxID=2174844 RepID=UPI000D617539|nr:ATP-binding protein [Maritimibacter sp. 55A14]PWE33984.1 hypothetical protein DDZ14_02135 [Maritimibacter sp. 55A14]
MNGIIAMAELMRRSPLTPEQADLLETIDRSGSALMHIINDVLDFSGIEAGHLQIEAAPFNLSATLRDVGRIIGPLAAEKGLDFDCGAPPAQLPLLMGDAGRLRQILINLTGNAVKFTEAGSVSLRVVREDGAQSAAVAFCVTDTGAGIAPQDKARIFEPFEQVDGKLTRRHGGTGLGLAISRRLARAMGGDIELTSTPGAGSSFWLTLPLRAAPRAATARHPAPRTVPAVDGAAVADGALAGVTILAAEDNATNRLILRKMLEDTGAALHLARDGVEAVDLFSRLRPDLVLMDMSMPRRNGLDATAHIRGIEAARGWPRCSVLALTANAFAEDRVQCGAAGMDGFLIKPIRRADLLDALAGALRPGPAAPAVQGRVTSSP